MNNSGVLATNADTEDVYYAVEQDSNSKRGKTIRVMRVQTCLIQMASRTQSDLMVSPSMPLTMSIGQSSQNLSLYLSQGVQSVRRVADKSGRGMG